MPRMKNKAHRIMYVVVAAYNDDTVMLSAFTTEKAASKEVEKLEANKHAESTVIYLIETVTLWYV